MTTQLRVPDATCGHCKATIEEAVGGLGGVTGAELDLETKLLRVQHDDSTSQKDVEATLVAAGYTPEQIA